MIKLVCKKYYQFILLIFIIPLFQNHVKSNQYETVDVTKFNSTKNEFAVKLNGDKLYFVQEISKTIGSRNDWRPLTKYKKTKLELENLNLKIDETIFNHFDLGDYLELDTITFFISNNKIYEYSNGKKRGLPINFNESKCLSINYHQNKLYYSSNQKWEYNKGFFFEDLDILFTEKDSKGNYSPPKKLKNINTDCEEAYVSFFENKIFFSRKCGNNDFDIYEYNLVTKKETKLPYPINSDGNDIFFEKNKNGYCVLSSDRKGGKGKNDLYLFKEKYRSQE